MKSRLPPTDYSDLVRLLGDQVVTLARTRWVVEQLERQVESKIKEHELAIEAKDNEALKLKARIAELEAVPNPTEDVADHESLDRMRARDVVAIKDVAG